MSSSFEDDDLDEDDAFLREAARIPERGAPDAEPDRTGEELGHYRLLSKLGQGGMGLVYAAEDLKLGRRVALKVLPRSAVAVEERRKRFMREARAASAVTHPNVAAVFDVGEADGTVYIAMEQVEGRTLRSVLEAQGGLLPLEEAVRVACEIARGIGRAHQEGIVHRDIKPENVMIGDDGHVKVLDFGLAKVAVGPAEPPATATSELATREGRILGTPSYMAPEQAKGRVVDASADVFSLGVVLYEMLAGRRPFVGDSAMEIFIAIDRDQPEPISRLRGEVSRPLEQIVMRCLAKAPGDRFADGRALAAALGAVAGRAARARGGARSVALAVLAVLVVAVAAWRLRSETAPPAGAQPEPSAAALAGTSPPLPLAPSAQPPTSASSPEPPARPSAPRAAPRPAPVPSAAPPAASSPRVDPLARQK